MKKILLMLICGSAALIATAQEQENAPKSSVIIKAGLNSANITVTDDGNVEDAKSLKSFHVGVVGDLYLANVLSFQPGILLTGKGSKTQSGQESDPNFYRATTNPLYLEIPANLVLKFPLASNAKIYAGAGPYLAIGIAGKNKVEGKVAGVEFESKEDIEWSNDDPTTLNNEEGAGFGILRRFDYGVNALAGVEFDKLILGAGYGLGLAKLQSGTDNSSSDNNKNRVWSFSLGYRF
ncbi:MAG TPA: porin family protein [Chitinophagaceae bacterium]|nr:porin family protein [Chitinophagaceae bacterium]